MTLTKASTLANDVEDEKDRLSEETMEIYSDEPAKEVLSWRLENDNDDMLNALGHTSDHLGDSYNDGSHAWLQYRLDVNTSPSNSKIVKIHNKRGFLAVNMIGKVYATGSEDDPNGTLPVHNSRRKTT